MHALAALVSYVAMLDWKLAGMPVGTKAMAEACCEKPIKLAPNTRLRIARNFTFRKPPEARPRKKLVFMADLTL
jgi:hypothetical protein